MKDKKKEDHSKYESLASHLDDRSASTDRNISQSDEESQKLVFLWDECNPPREDAEGVMKKTLQKIENEDAPTVIRGKARSALMPAWMLVAATIALLIGCAYFFYQEEGTADERAKMEQLMLAATATDDVKEVTLVVSDKKKIEIANNSQVAYTQAGQVHVNSAKLDEAAVAEETAATEEKEDVEEE